MSKSLSITPDWSSVRGITDPVDSRSWSSLTIIAGDTTITEVADVNNGISRASIGVPAFPIAEWLVSNWWSLLYEPVRNERIFRPVKGREEADFWWIKRHCLRAADSSLLLPPLYFYNNGRGVALCWLSDEVGLSPHFSAEFTAESGILHLPTDSVKSRLSEFVDCVLDRVGKIQDSRVADTGETWQAIQSATFPESAFCAIAGRMGLNPYAPDEVSAATAQVIDRIIERGANLPVHLDLTEVAFTEHLEADLDWVQAVSSELKIGPSKSDSLPSLTSGNRAVKPYDFGYRTAKLVRQHLRLGEESLLPSVEDTASAIFEEPLQVVNRNHLNDLAITGIVGWTDSGKPVIAGPKRPQAPNERFRLARGFYHALCSCHDSQRLLTTANTWDQQASRAFAAELLAPQDSLLSQYESGSTITQLASLYNVSDHLVSRQLENASGLRYE